MRKFKILKPIIFTAAVLGLGVFVFSAKVSAASTWYVTTKPCAWVNNKVATYNPDADTCAGGSATAFNSIDNALANSSVVAGDTILVADGLYTAMTARSGFSTHAFLRKGGSSENSRMTIKSKNKWGAHISCQNKSASTFGIDFNTDVKYVTIEDFEITDCKFGLGANVNNDYLIVKNNKLHDVSNGVSLGNETDYALIDSNIIYNFGGYDVVNDKYDQYHGIYLRGINTTAQNNLIYNNLYDGWSVQIGSYGTKPSGTYKIINNTLVGTNNSHNVCVVLYNVNISNLNLHNNACFGANQGLVYYLSNPWPVSGWEAKRNILDSASSVCYKGTGDCANCNSVLCPTTGGEANIFTNSMGFADKGNNNYALAINSPAIDTGLSTFAPAHDIVGTSRPQNGKYDIGAYEYQGNTSSGKTYYVCNSAATCNTGAAGNRDWVTGSNNNAGTSRREAFLTIQKAYNIMNPGDTVIVGKGTYYAPSDNNGYILYGRYRGGAINAEMIFKAETKGEVLLHGGNSGPIQDYNVGSNCIQLDENTSKYITIDGFEIAYCKYYAVMFNYQSAVGNAPKNITIKNNHIHHIKSSGITMTNGTTGMLIDSNVIHDISWYDNPGGNASGIYVRSVDSTIQNNVIYNIYDNGSCIQFYSAGLNNLSGLKAVNNTCAKLSSNAVQGFLLYNDHANNYFENNIFTGFEGSGQPAILCSGSSTFTNTYVRNNLTDVGMSLLSSNCSNKGINVSGNIAGNPLLKNVANNNYALANINSPAYNAGLATNAPTYDFTGNQRIGLPDIGAYEYNSGSNNAPADVNNDQSVNIKDIQICIKAIVAPGSFTTPEQLNQLAKCKAVAPPPEVTNIKDIQEIIREIIA